MKPLTKSLITLAAVLGATAAFAAGGDQLRERDQLKDGSCIELGAGGTSLDCLLLGDQDQIKDQIKAADRLRDGSCLDGDGVPDRDGDGAKAQTRTRSGAETGKGAIARSGQ